MLKNLIWAFLCINIYFLCIIYSFKVSICCELFLIMKKTATARGKKPGSVKEEQKITSFFNKLAVQTTSKSNNKIVNHKINEPKSIDHASHDRSSSQDSKDKIKSDLKIDNKVLNIEDSDSDSDFEIVANKPKLKNIKENLSSPKKNKNITPTKNSQLIVEINKGKSSNFTPNNKNIKKRVLEIDSPDIIPDTPEEIQKINKNKQKIFENTTNFSKSPPSKKACTIIENFNEPIVESTSHFKVSPVKNISPSKSSPQKGTPLKNPISPSKSNPKLKRSLFDIKNSTAPKMAANFLNTDLDNLFDDDWDVEVSKLEDQINELNLETWQYCKITELCRDNSQNIIIKIQSIASKKETSCILQGVWQYSNLQPNDIVNILAVKNSGAVPFCINNDTGFLILEPDTLISPTSIVNSQFCKRKGILQEKFRGFESENKVMIVGNLVHRLLQDALKKEIYQTDLLDKRLEEILSSKDMLYTSFSSQVSIDDLKTELKTFVPKIVNFVDSYVKSNRNKSQTKNPDNWQGKIKSIQDIEENIWDPQLGIKGKIDITIEAGNFGQILPLELKTGRATMSLEHRGQVAFYIMVMNDLGYKVSSGLLLYLRENVLKEVIVGHREKRDLLMLRNEFVYYLKKSPKIPEIGTNSEEKLQFSELPEPINHHSACKKCPYSNICTALLSRDDSYVLSEDNPLKKISEECLQNLKQSHIDYFIKWTSLLTLESNYKPPMKEIKDIWKLPPYKRERRGKSICYLNISTRVKELRDNFSHTFSRAVDKKISDIIVEKRLQNDFISSGLSPGNYVVVSTDTRTALATGFITNITNNSVTINLERDLSERYSNKIFHVDTYNNSHQIVNFSASSVAALLDSTERAQKLRELIIDRQESEISGQLHKSKIIKLAGIIKQLNKNQQRAVLKALTVKDYLLIKGMPGTGKTATIVSLIQLLVKLNKTVLITSHTHSAVDNVCLRLLNNKVDFLRLGNENRVHPLIKHRSETFLTANCTSVEEIQEIYNKSKIIAVTCLGANHPILNQITLDFCIVDESTQVIQCSLIKALLSCNSFILIGDPDQLPPIVKNPEALQRGMNESLFDRLDNLNSTITLTEQYRMNQIITDLANSVTYNDQLKCANDAVAFAVLNLPNFDDLKSKYKKQQWIVDILSLELENSVVAIDTGPTWCKKQRSEDLLQDQQNSEDLLEDIQVGPQNVEEDENRKCSNNFEASLVIVLVEALRFGGLNADSIGIVTPYRAQVYLLKKLLSEIYENDVPEVNTVDQYQGRDKEVIIYSCTRSRDTSKAKNSSGFEILEDKRRLTVAITRAKHKLIIIGDFESLKEYSPFQTLLDKLEDHQKLVLNDGKYEFDWEEIKK